jgi:hypothetical protein
MLQRSSLPLMIVLSATLLTSEIAPSADDAWQSVPLFDDDAMIRVPVSAFGRTLYFLLDTGFTVSAIDTKYEPLLGNAYGTYLADSPLGTNNRLPVFHGPDISIAGKTMALDKITCLNLKMARLISGQPCDGILGMDFFTNNVVSIDFDGNMVCISTTVPDKIRRTFTPVPLMQRHQHYAIAVSVNHGQTLDLMVDTGDNSSISLNPKEWRKVISTGETNSIAATIAGIGNQVAQSKIGVISHLSVQNLNYSNLHATCIRNPDDPSHLGLGFFRRHNVAFDFANHVLYLKPGRQFSLPDNEDMSGLHLLRNGEETIVYSVDENSPASNSGVRSNDLIEAVNGENASSLTMKAIRRILQSHDGDTITLRVRRGGDLVYCHIALRKAL